MKNKQKTMLIPVSSSFFARNFMNSDAFKILRKNDLRIILLVSQEKFDYYKSEYESDNVIIEKIVNVRKILTENIFQFIEQSSIVTSRSLIDAHTALNRRSNERNIIKVSIKKIFRYINFLFKMLLRTFGMFGCSWRSIIRELYYFLPIKYFSEIYDKYQPELVFCPTMVWAEDYILIREAKRRGIKTVGMVFSWDTFYSKTFLRLHPDVLIVQTEKIKEQAIKFGDYPQNKIYITGVIQYDRYFNNEGIMERVDFMNKIGGDESKKLILYAFSGKAGFMIDLKIIELIHELIQTKRIIQPVQVLLRPYPRYDFSEEKLNRLKLRYGFLGEPSTAKLNLRNDWEMDEKSVNLLANSLAHADLVITMYSTFLIEAAVFDKPTIAIAFDGNHKYDYWNSAKRFFDWDHLKDIKPLNGINIVRNVEELENAINSYLIDPDIHKSGRSKIVEQQCYYTDGKAGERTASVIINKINE